MVQDEELPLPGPTRCAMKPARCEPTAGGALGTASAAGSPEPRDSGRPASTLKRSRRRESPQQRRRHSRRGGAPGAVCGPRAGRSIPVAKRGPRPSSRGRRSGPMLCLRPGSRVVEVDENWTRMKKTGSCEMLLILVTACFHWSHPTDSNRGPAHYEWVLARAIGRYREFLRVIEKANNLKLFNMLGRNPARGNGFRRFR